MPRWARPCARPIEPHGLDVISPTPPTAGPRQLPVLAKYRGFAAQCGAHSLSTPNCTMPATEITVTSAGKVAGQELLVPTGQEGAHYAHIQDWLSAQLKAKKAVRDISQQVLVKGIKQWAVYEAKSGKAQRWVFKIT